MAMIFFLVGLFFKISLVPFHLWTPDVYEGAPTSVTAYLSVISKGAGAFVLLTILIKVFAPFVLQWQAMLYGLIILTITVANLFAIDVYKRQAAYRFAPAVLCHDVYGHGRSDTVLLRFPRP